MKLPKLISVNLADHEGSIPAYRLELGEIDVFVCLPTQRGQTLCIMFGELGPDGSYEERSRDFYNNLSSAELRELGKAFIKIAKKHPRNKLVRT